MQSRENTTPTSAFTTVLVSHDWIGLDWIGLDWTSEERGDYDLSTLGGWIHSSPQLMPTPTITPAPNFLIHAGNRMFVLERVVHT